MTTPPSAEKKAREFYSDQQKQLVEVLEKLTTMRIFTWNEMKAFVNREGEYKYNYGGEELCFVNALILHKNHADFEELEQELVDQKK